MITAHTKYLCNDGYYCNTHAFYSWLSDCKSKKHLVHCMLWGDEEGKGRGSSRLLLPYSQTVYISPPPPPQLPLEFKPNQIFLTPPHFNWAHHHIWSTMNIWYVYENAYEPHPSAIWCFKRNNAVTIRDIIIRLTHANVWDSMGKPCAACKLMSTQSSMRYYF